MDSDNIKSEKRSYHVGNLEQTLVDLAIAQLEASGPEQLSLRDLARKAGVSPNAPYRHFPDKSALLGAVVARGFRLLAQGFRESEGADRFLSYGEAYLRFAQERPGLFRLMFSGQIEACPSPENEAWQLLSAAIRERIPAAGEEQVAITATAAWGLVHGLAVLRLEGLCGEFVPLKVSSEAFAAMFDST